MTAAAVENDSDVAPDSLSRQAVEDLPEFRALTVAEQGMIHRKATFLDALRKCGNISQAARDAGIERQTHYDWMKSKDLNYIEAVADALEEAGDYLIQEARRRAAEGWEEPVYGRVSKEKDGQIGTVRRFDSGLLMFLIKGDRPEKYRDKVLNIKGSVQVDVQPMVPSWMSQLSGAALKDAMTHYMSLKQQGLSPSAEEMLARFAPMNRYDLIAPQAVEREIVLLPAVLEAAGDSIERDD